mgnify:CR=1 FL=1
MHRCPPLTLLPVLLPSCRYICWRDTILVSLNAYISTWQLLAAWPPSRVRTAPPPLAAGTEHQYHPASRLPWLAMEALYMDGFMWLLVVAMACQVRDLHDPFSVHRPFRGRPIVCFVLETLKTPHASAHQALRWVHSRCQVGGAPGHQLLLCAVGAAAS